MKGVQQLPGGLAPANKKDGNRGVKGARELVQAIAEASKLSKRSRPLDERQLKFVHCVGHEGLSPTTALRHAGYPEKHFPVLRNRFANDLRIQQAIQRERELAEKAQMMTKKRVMDGFLEAIDMGRMKADSIAMTSGWREIAKMCGYYEPTRHKLEVSVSGEVVIQKLQALTDADLLKLADGNTDALEGEFKVIQHE